MTECTLQTPVYVIVYITC